MRPKTIEVKGREMSHTFPVYNLHVSIMLTYNWSGSYPVTKNTAVH